MNVKILTAALLGLLAGLVAGFTIANSINRSEINSLRGQAETGKKPAANSTASADGFSISDDELKAKIAEADANPENIGYQKNLGSALYRYATMKNNPDIAARTNGHLPVVVIDKAINDRMASTVRHNRARGKHSVAGMSNMVFEMLDNGWSDADICNELGMEPEELLRLKHITGFSKLFKDVEYKKAWQSRHQAKLKATWGDTQSSTSA